MIPKIIHYCWFGQKPLPKMIEICISTWKKNLPDFEIILWNEKNSPMEEPFVKQAYSSKKYAFVSDYVRFWILFNHGGIYFDTDMFVVKPFDKLLNTDFFIAWENPEKTMLGFCVIGSIARHPMLSEALKTYHDLIFNPEKLDDYIIPRLISPVLISQQDFQAKNVFSYDYFYPFPFEKRNENNFMKYITQNTYAIHLWNLSWVSWNNKIKNRVLGKILYILKLWRLWK